jgi:hypothetical protein
LINLYSQKRVKRTNRVRTYRKQQNILSSVKKKKTQE